MLTTLMIFCNGKSLRKIIRGSPDSMTNADYENFSLCFIKLN